MQLHSPPSCWNRALCSLICACLVLANATGRVSATHEGSLTGVKGPALPSLWPAAALVAQLRITGAEISDGANGCSDVPQRFDRTPLLPAPAALVTASLMHGTAAVQSPAGAEIGSGTHNGQVTDRAATVSSWLSH